MNNVRSSSQGCSNNPECSCKDPLSVCELHPHMKSDFFSDYNTKPLFVTHSGKETSILKTTRKILIENKNRLLSKITEKFNAKIAEIRQEFQDEVLSLNERINPLLKRLEEALTTNNTLRSSNDELFIKLYEGLSLPHHKLISHTKVFSQYL